MLNGGVIFLIDLFTIISRGVVSSPALDTSSFGVRIKSRRDTGGIELKVLFPFNLGLTGFTRKRERESPLEKKAIQDG